MRTDLKIRWEKYPASILDTLSAIPGGIPIVEETIRFLDFRDNLSVLDLNPGAGSLSAILSSEYKSKVDFSLSPSGKIDAPDNTFDRVIAISSPMPISLPPGLISEIYRVLTDGGLFGFSGPFAYKNDTPPWMRNALKTMSCPKLRTPALLALNIAESGFMISAAEYLMNSWDHWTRWLDCTPDSVITDEFRRAIVEDAGRWLALGIVVLKKPPKPPWAI